ncbi:MAG TPA: hypothetical protein VN824_03715, partial [Puia sp.]|nr:hypothetical protein [Puia sp.]
RYQDLALAFAEWVVSPAVQSTFYVEHGGQPGHRMAWMNDMANRLTNNFFYTLLATMERGYMRPRYDGYLFFQDHGGDAVQEFLLGKRDVESALDVMNNLYRESINLFV